MKFSPEESIASLSPGSYGIDPTRSTVRFRTTHLFGLGKVDGTFALRPGTVEVAEPLSASSVRAEVDAASFHTGTDARNRSVRSARFLDTDRHPVISFVSTRIDGLFVTGELTVRQVTRPVTLAVREVADAADGFRIVATTRVDRLEFGVTGSRGMTGRYLDLTVEAMCVRAEPGRGRGLTDG